MSRVPDGVSDENQLNVVAREVLLDALEALESQASAVTVVGAQAIYLRSDEVRLTVASFTSDADLSLDPALLADVPLIETVLTEAGFAREGQPGQWYTRRDVGGVDAPIAVDLLVPEAVGGRRGRSASIPPHAKHAARQVDGLEAALVDANSMPVVSLLPTGEAPRRVVSARVAGPAALFVAKAFKINQRNGESGRSRLDNKDAGDVVRLMLATESAEVAGRFEVLLTDERTAAVTREGLDYLHALFAGARTIGTTMALEALAADPIEPELVGIVRAYLETLPE